MSKQSKKQKGKTLFSLYCASKPDPCYTFI